MQGKPPMPKDRRPYRITKKVRTPKHKVPPFPIGQKDLATRVLTKDMRKVRHLEEAFKILTGEIVNPEGPQTVGNYQYITGEKASWRIDYVWEHHSARHRERYELKISWKTLDDHGQLVIGSDDSLIDWIDHIELMLSPACQQRLPQLKEYVKQLEL